MDDEVVLHDGPGEAMPSARSWRKVSIASASRGARRLPVLTSTLYPVRVASTLLV
jgi:hypothetical protein